MTDYSNLECPTCGSALRVTANLESIVCQACKSEFTINHSGGSIAIHPVKINAGTVDAGTERLPSETAIQHLKDDIALLEKDLSSLKVRKERSLRSLLWLVPIVLIMIGIFVLVALSSVDAAVWLIAIGLAAALLISLSNIERARQGTLKLERLEQDLDQKKKELTSHLGMASNGK